MSKAFTRESDDVPEPRTVRPSPLPPGAKNYLTPGGARRLREELDRLAQRKPAPDSVEARRILHLRQSLQTAVEVSPPAPPWEQVRFGASVTVRNGSGEETSYRIVGMDETDADRNQVSCFSPIAKALLNARRGQRVWFKFPSGEEQLEIIAITYEE